MIIDKQVRIRVESIFGHLNKVGAQTLPPAGSLSRELEAALHSSRANAVNITIKPQVAVMFATAAVEMWLRSVHSFLISASLTDASPIWASASGYYSSHYAVRALGHLLGYFQLFRRKRIVRLQQSGSGYFCSFDPKTANDREHRFYWKLLKQDQHFAADPLFTENISEIDASDVGHREHANYVDHVSKFPNFRPLDIPTLKARVELISNIPFTVPPIPRKSHFPETDAVQVVAYQRIVKFRQFLDTILGGSNRFWKVHRSPSWTEQMLSFQLIEQGSLASFYS